VRLKLREFRSLHVRANKVEKQADEKLLEFKPYH